MALAITWLVVWVLLALVGTVVVYIVTAGIGIIRAAATGNIAPAPIGILLGIVLAALWFGLAVYHVVLQVIAVVGLAG